MIIILFLMVASLVLVFLGLATDITIRTTGTSPLVHMLLTYAGLLVTLLRIWWRLSISSACVNSCWLSHRKNTSQKKMPRAVDTPLDRAPVGQNGLWIAR